MPKTLNHKEPKCVNLAVRFTHKPVTVWGGLKLVADWFDKIKLVDYMSGALSPLNPESNNGYSPVMTALSFMVSILLGAKKISHTMLLATDAPVQHMFGITAVPSGSTFTRFFRKFKQSTIEQVFPDWNRTLLEQRRNDLATHEVILDLDSTIFIRYGTQEGAEVGYNPRRPGRPSHHPLFAVIGDIKFIVHAWLRRGKTGSSSGAIAFLQEALTRLPSGVRIKLIRADSGFFGNKFFFFCEQENILYIVVANSNQVVRRIIREMCGVVWKPLGRGIDIGEAQYQAYGWPAPRRLIVIRQQIEERPTAQGKLFPELPLYRYQIMVTNVSWCARDVWNCYRQRAGMENYLKECKEDYYMHKFSLQKFYATEAALWFNIMVWNLMSWFNQQVLQQKHSRLMTIRLRYFLCGALLGREQKRDVLRLHNSPKWRRTFLCLRRRLFLLPVSTALQWKSPVAGDTE